tara:strand:+ start:12 stop:914 length:903 start_codon:yes stop_codon:yes gene_type:complete
MSEKIGWNPVVKRKYPGVKKKDSKRKAPPKGKGLSFKERMKIAKSKLKAQQASMPIKNPTRATIMSQQETKTKKSAWHGIRMGIIEDRAKTTMPHTSYVKKTVNVPKGHEIVSDHPEDLTSKVQKAPKGVGGSIEDTTGIVTKAVTTEEPAKAHWRDYFTNKVISKPEHIEIDHVVPITRMRKGGALKSLESQQLFGSFLKNLVITKSETNQAKKGQTLSTFKPPHKPERYARKYHDVLKDFGAVMTHGEERGYKKMTGENPTIATQHALDWKRGEHVSETQYRHDAAKKRMNARQATTP